MKICRADSVFRGWCPGRSTGNMGTLAASPVTKHFQRFYRIFKEHLMAWTTPAATDLRFGFEITMYIANR